MNQKTQSDLLVSVLPGLRAYVGRIAGDRQAVGDLLQEASVRILAGEGPEDPERFLAWCCGIARHVRASDWRARRRARTELPLESEAAAAVCAPQRDPDSHLDARAWVARAMAQTDRLWFTQTTAGKVASLRIP
jgi:DNA-directed RNA polymerase specialized sigma24 family protein